MLPPPLPCTHPQNPRASSLPESRVLGAKAEDEGSIGAMILSSWPWVAQDSPVNTQPKLAPKRWVWHPRALSLYHCISILGPLPHWGLCSHFLKTGGPYAKGFLSIAGPLMTFPATWSCSYSTWLRFSSPNSSDQLSSSLSWPLGCGWSLILNPPPSLTQNRPSGLFASPSESPNNCFRNCLCAAQSTLLLPNGEESTLNLKDFTAVICLCFYYIYKIKGEGASSQFKDSFWKDIRFKSFQGMDSIFKKF